MKTKSELFVTEKRERWNKLKNILQIIQKNSFKALSEEQTRDFSKLYRMTCADLAEARMLKLSPDVLNYLNNIVGQAHQFLYSRPLLHKQGVLYYIKNKALRVFADNKGFVIASALLFLLPLVISYIVTLANPDFARAVLGDSTVDFFADSYAESVSTGRTNSMNVAMVGYYIQHNISIGFLSFATGIFLGLGTIYFLVYNGIVLGSVAAYIVQLGYGDNFWNFVCAHSVFELTGLILAGAAGLLLGHSILQSLRNMKKEVMQKRKDDILNIVGVSVFFLFCAALIEGNLSPSGLPFAAKVVVLIFSVVFIGYFFIVKQIIERQEQ